MDIRSRLLGLMRPGCAYTEPGSGLGGAVAGEERMVQVRRVCDIYARNRHRLLSTYYVAGRGPRTFFCVCRSRCYQASGGATFVASMSFSLRLCTYTYPCTCWGLAVRESW